LLPPLEVLELLVKGATYPLIGQALGIGTGKVQSHIKAIYRKLEVSTKAEAAAEAWRRGLVS
jgi:DNA-binding CsgD family transcriptional regulator